MSIFTILFGFFLSFSQLSEGLYEKGLQKLSNGDVNGALQIWYQAKLGESTQESVAVGIHFSEVVVREKKQDFYEPATEMYYWALENASQRVWNEDLAKYVFDSTVPTIEKEFVESFKKAFKNKNPAFFSLIKQYWISQDPTLSSLANERLLEQIFRVIQIKETFTNPDDNRLFTFIGGDRSQLFLKYGPPSRRVINRFDLDVPQLSAWAEDLYNNQTFGSAEAFLSGDPESIADRQFTKAKRIRWLTDLSKTFFNHPQYEIWLYKSLSEPGEEEKMFMFGKSTEDADFRQLNAIEDMVPNAAYRSREQLTGIRFLTPGILLQLMYYEQLAALHSYFGRSLSDFEMSLFTTGGIVGDAGRQFAHRNEAEYRFQLVQLPAEDSIVQDSLSGIQFRIKDFQLLDDKGRPESLVVFESDFVYALMSDAISNGEAFDNYYFTQHVFATREFRDTLHFKTNVLAPEDFVSLIGQMNFKPYSLFYIPNLKSEKVQYRASSELINLYSENLKPKASFFPSSIRAVQSNVFEVSDPLPDKKDDLLMSDLILGTQINNSDDRIPFNLSFDNIFFSSEDPVLHFEVYHLSHDEANASRSYTATISIGEYGGLFGRRIKDSNVNISLDLKSSYNYDRQTISLQSPMLKEPGRYSIMVSVEDKNSGKKANRRVNLTIVSGSENN